MADSSGVARWRDERGRREARGCGTGRQRTRSVGGPEPATPSTAAGGCKSSHPEIAHAILARSTAHPPTRAVAAVGGVGKTGRAGISRPRPPVARHLVPPLFAIPPPCQNFYPYLSSPSHSEECGGGRGDAGTYRGRWWRRSELGRPGRKSLSSRACLGEATGCGIALFLSRSVDAQRRGWIQSSAEGA